MNIDLLFSRTGHLGLVSDHRPACTVAGVMFDSTTGLLTLEFAEADPLDLNIPVGPDFVRKLTETLDIYVGIIENNVITDSRRVPVILSDDPFGGGNTGFFAAKPARALTAFEYFLKNCESGQPVHRDDLGDEGSAGGVMSGLSPAVLQFSPQLARQRAIEAAQRAAPTIVPAAPGFGPKGMGGGGNSLRGTTYRAPPAAPASDDEE